MATKSESQQSRDTLAEVIEIQRQKCIESLQNLSEFTGEDKDHADAFIAHLRETIDAEIAKEETLQQPSS